VLATGGPRRGRTFAGHAGHGRGTSSCGSIAPPGVYFVRLTTALGVAERRVAVIR